MNLESGEIFYEKKLYDLPQESKTLILPMLKDS